MKKLLITGGAGFIGSEFVRQAVAKGYRVSVLDALTYAGDKLRLKDVYDNIDSFKINITNASSGDSIVKKLRPDIIVHFAAETHVDRSILDGQIFLKTNVLGTHALLEAARHHGIERFVQISTDEVYGDVLKGESKESDAFKPNSPYSVSKASADMLVSAYARTYQLPINIIRACNNYGPWQYPEKLIPVIILKALNNQPIPVYGKGLNVREWLYVSDCASAVMALMEQAKIGAIYNIGSGIQRKNIDIVKAILKILGRSNSLIKFVKDRPGHDFRYSIDCYKAKDDLNVKIEFDLDKGLNHTVEWFRGHQSWINNKFK